MDPNHWNNFNQQAYSRLGAHSGGIPATASLNRFELPMLDQAALSTGLGASLSPSMAAHSSLPQQRPLPGLPGVNYAHPMHSSMSQFLDTMNSLQPGFVGQPTYKPPSIASTVSPTTPYNLEASVRLHAEATSSLSRYTPSAPAASHVGKPLLFNTDPHTMKETSPLTGFHSVSSTSPPATDAPKNWQLSNFVPPPSNPFGNLSDVGSSPPSGYSGMTSPDPPPAHSGSRPSTIQRNPYQGQKSHAVEASHVLARPAHSPHGQGSFIDSVLRETRSTGFTSPSPLPVHRSEPLLSPQSRPAGHYSFVPSTVVSDTNSSRNASTHDAYPSLSGLSDIGSYSSYNPLNTSSTYITTTASPAYSSSQVVTSQMKHGNFDIVTAAKIQDSQAIDSATSSNAGSFTGMELQGLPDMNSATVEKMNIQEPRPSVAVRGSIQASPQHMASMSGMSPSQHHATVNMAAMTNSPQHRVSSMPGIPLEGGPSSQVPLQQSPLQPSPQVPLQQSPMQASPISVGSPQVVLPMGSPQQSVIGSSTNAGPPPMPVQAVADSTTSKPKRKRGRKKGSQNKVAAPPPPLSMTAGPTPETFTYTDPSFTSPVQEVPMAPVNVGSSQHYTPSPAHVSAYDTPPSVGTAYESPPLQHIQQGASFDTVNQLTPPAMTQAFDPHAPSMPSEQQAMVYDSHAGMIMSSPGASHTLPLDSTPTPSTPSASAQSYDSPVMPQMVTASSGTLQEGLETTKVVANALDEDGVFMTNEFGNAFVSPNDVLGMENVLPQNPTNPMTEDDPMVPGQTTTPMKMKTKAEQKQMPLSVVVDDDFDDEFKHLLQEPVIPPPSVPKKRSPGRPPKIKPEVKAIPIIPPPPVKPKLQSPNSAFQSSFLSFLQGKTPETLSSVTNSSMAKKPQLPKYVPDPRPRKTSSSTGRPVGISMRGVKDDDKFSDSNSTADSKSVDVPSITFSDDEDTSQNIAKTVQNVITNLNEDSKSDTSNTTITPQPLAFETLQPPATKTTTSKRGRKPGSFRGGKRGRGRRKSLLNRSALLDEDKESVTDVGSIDDARDADFVPDLSGETEEAPTPPPMRVRSERRAKTKMEEKRKSKAEKKKKLKRSSTYEEEISSLSDASVSLSEGEDFVPVTSEEEKDYDSDKDPAWTPFGQESSVTLQVRHASSGSDDEHGRPRGRGRGRGKKMRMSASKSGRGRGRGRGSAVKSLPADIKKPVVEVFMEDDQEDLVHTFQKGNFVIEKADLHLYDSFPIWKIDAGRLIQKFAAKMENGRLIHQALSTYSSWGDFMKGRYKPIKTRSVPGYSMETVEVLEKFKPKPTETTDLSKLENDEMMQTFNVYMQILISQALEPGFIDAIKDSGDNADYYLEPFNKIDSLIQSKLKSLESKLNWDKDFKESVDSHHCMKLTDVTEGSKHHCQAFNDKKIPAINMAQLYGEEYDRETLESKGASQIQDLYVGEEAASQLKHYHALQHFKFTLFKRCVAKSGVVREENNGLDNSAVVDQCLHNRGWVQQLFLDLKRLLEDGELKT